MQTNLNLGSGLSALSLGLPAGMVVFIAATLLIVHFIIVLVLANTVRVDAMARASRGQLFLISPMLWFWIVLLTGGYFATLAYWLIHYSSLRTQA